MAFKEGLTEQEYTLDIENAKKIAVEGMFSKEQLTKEVEKATKGLIKNEDFEKIKNDYETKLKNVNNELVKYKGNELSEAEKQALEYKQKYERLENQMKLGSMLEEKGLPRSLADLKFKDFEKSEDYVAELTKILENVQADRPFVPTKGNSGKQQGNITREDFKKMGYSEMCKLAEENPTLFEQLSQVK
ncbi:hypothetical protein G8T75_12860 [Clostridium botulinum D/C]|uniref:hypothetical protein n=1 Tax=Clostridium botulinum TaxID=1491 RepID=UPI001E54832E|nr:hypothetical protein [Clostridium botulinum]MCD3240848.1 hypothetical protein [Clostridium botulinum D/C]